MKYRVCAEVLIPGINTTDLASIFEEHRVCKELGVLGQHQFHEVSIVVNDTMIIGQYCVIIALLLCYYCVNIVLLLCYYCVNIVFVLGWMCWCVW